MKEKKVKTAFKKGASSDNPDRIKDKNDSNKRDRATINRLQMYKSGRAIRDKKGVIQGGELRSKHQAGGVDISSSTGRVLADRRWFGNTRVIGQTEMDTFREALSSKLHDPYSVVLQTKTLPMGLLSDPTTTRRAHLLSTESFQSVFGPKAQRKRPKLAIGDTSGLANVARAASDSYFSSEHVDADRIDVEAKDRFEGRAAIFDKGQSRRIWGELYKVLDSSDVIFQILDARNPAGTRSKHVEAWLKEHGKHKHVVLVLNKCDLVPTWVTRRWVSILSKDYPTLAFHASMTHPFGKSSVLALLRQFAKLHSDKKNISVGFVGYPNVGKSSVINTLKSKKVCNVAPVPGETKVWQYVTLMKRVFLIDCPGVVPPTDDSEVDIVLKGVVRAEKLENPEFFIPAILSHVKKEHIAKIYNLSSWTDANDLLVQIATLSGKLGKGGEPDVSTVAKGMIVDWQRGRIPFYFPPPESDYSTLPGEMDANSYSANNTKSEKASSREGKNTIVISDPKQEATISVSSEVLVGSTLPRISVSQAIPRLGAHALLEEEEKAGDKGKFPFTRLGGERTGEDEDEGAEAGNVERVEEKDDGRDLDEETGSNDVESRKRKRQVMQKVSSKAKKINDTLAITSTDLDAILQIDAPVEKDKGSKKKAKFADLW
jgi:nuclear GTP-binding protein